MVISAVLEGAVMSFSKCAVISGATERSSPRVTDVNGLEKGSETKCAGSDEERDLCYGVKRANASRSGTSQNPQTPTPNQHQSQKHKSHVL